LLIVPLRTLILYLLVILVVRLMGKHQIGQLQPYELVITIMISELAAVPMQDMEIPLLHGIIPIVTLLFIQATFSFVALKNDSFRRFIDGNPSILIENGRINQSEMAKLRFTIDDLLEKIRFKDFPNISDIEYAILETSGDLSVIPKSQKRPVCPQDLNLATAYEGLPLSLIVDGKLKKKNLAKLNLTEEWLMGEIKKFGLTQWREVFLASIDTSGNVFIQPKRKRA